MLSVSGISGTERIVFGSYTGTGKGGESNPNSLTFDFAPQIVWFYTRYALQSAGYYLVLLHVPSMSTSYTSTYVIRPDNNYYSYCKRSTDGKKIYWYATSSDGYAQLNSSGVTYHYVAIG